MNLHSLADSGLGADIQYTGDGSGGVAALFPCRVTKLGGSRT
ncbi:hypothetical protein ACFFK0_22270 [Paenibacillus chartarius]|uniref:Uncharacterized protein n=1 Tax=Paenibacillus chartarius TaxID=747481 RepID=A0ABV6DR43_9BACL